MSNLFDLLGGRKRKTEKAEVPLELLNIITASKFKTSESDDKRSVIAVLLEWHLENVEHDSQHWLRKCDYSVSEGIDICYRESVCVVAVLADGKSFLAFFK